MAGRIQSELKQTKPFGSVEEEAFLNLQRTADFFLQGLVAALKPYAISPAQYNVLRILRGAEPDGLPCGEIGNRMITRDPDITRLLDRLEKRSLVARCRENKDRRVITVRITPEGLELLSTLEPVMEGFDQGQLSQLGERKLKMLIDLLEQARGA